MPCRQAVGAADSPQVQVGVPSSVVHVTMLLPQEGAA